MLSMSDTVAATGASDAITITKGRVQVTGTWEGTVNVQTSVDEQSSFANEYDPNSGAEYAFTENFNFIIDNEYPTPTRIYFTRTSGTVAVTIRGDSAQH